MPGQYADRQLQCVECQGDFTFTVEEQEYHEKAGFQNEPKRCPSCRNARRQRGDSRSGGGGGSREFHTTECSECGKEARVPFKPRGDRPVYCSSCFEQRR